MKKSESYAKIPALAAKEVRDIADEIVCCAACPDSDHLGFGKKAVQYFKNFCGENAIGYDILEYNEAGVRQVCLQLDALRKGVQAGCPEGLPQEFGGNQFLDNMQDVVQGVRDEAGSDAFTAYALLEGLNLYLHTNVFQVV